MIARVFVMPKQEVLDPQGQAIRHSLHALGYGEVGEVRLGKYLEVEITAGDLDTAHARVDEMCRRLLANLVIEEYRFEITDGTGTRAGKSDARRSGALP
jgi:phosphoribosylformylglycinamidine synthase